MASQIEQDALNGVIQRGRRCQNCKYFSSGERLYETLLKEQPEWYALEDYPQLRANGVELNKGLVDELLRQVKAGGMGECPHNKDTRVVSASYLCEKWEGLPGMKETFKAKDDLLPEEIKQLREEV